MISNNSRAMSNASASSKEPIVIKPLKPLWIDVLDTCAALANERTCQLQYVNISAWLTDQKRECAVLMCSAEHAVYPDTSDASQPQAQQVTQAQEQVETQSQAPDHAQPQ